MNKKFITFFLFFFSLNLWAEEQGLQVFPGGEALFEAQAGQIISTAFRIRNTTGMEMTLKPELELPEGWRLIIPALEFDMTAQSTDIKPVSILVPGNAPPGKYSVTYRVTNIQYPSFSDFYSIEVNVAPRLDLHMEMMDAEAFVIDGDVYSFKIQLYNHSNVADTIRIHAAASNNLSIDFKPESIFLKPGESAVINAFMHTDGETRQKRRIIINFETWFFTSEENIFRKSHVVDLIPRIAGEEVKYHKLPVKLGLKGVAHYLRTHKTDFQGELEAEGSLDESGQKRVAFHIRGPDIYGTSIYSQRNRIFGRFETPKFGIELGDKSYQMTYLTERSRYGRGFESFLKLGKTQFGFLSFRTLWRVSEQDQSGFYLRSAAGEKYRISVNYLIKKDVDTDGWILSVDQSYKFMEESEISLEYAAGKNQEKNTDAARAKISGKLKNINYHFDFIHADKNFPGYYRDTQYITANVSYAPIDALVIRGAFNQSKQNFALDTTRYSAPLSHFKMLGIQYRITTSQFVNIEYFRQGMKDRLPSPRFAYDESILRLGYGQYFGMISYNLKAELGLTENGLFNKKFAYEQYSVNFNFNPGPRQNYQGYININKDGRYSNYRQTRIVYGVNLSYELFTRTSLRFMLQNSYSPEDLHRDRNLFDFQLVQRLPGNQEISLKARQTLLRHSTDQKDIAAILEYTARFGVPVSKKRDTGVIYGRVYDEENQECLSNIMVHLRGMTAVTNANGEYRFVSVPPGVHYLHIDQAGTGLDRVPTVKLPKEVVIKGGERFNLDIGVIRSARLEGRVIQYTFDDDSAGVDPLQLRYRVNNDNGNSLTVEQYKPLSEMQGVIVELQREDEIQRRVSDRLGRISFADLRPGTWHVKLSAPGMPDYHYFEEETFTIELEPGQKKDILIRILPERRRIRMLRQGEELIEEMNGSSENRN